MLLHHLPFLSGKNVALSTFRLQNEFRNEIPLLRGHEAKLISHSFGLKLKETAFYLYSNAKSYCHAHASLVIANIKSFTQWRFIFVPFKMPCSDFLCLFLCLSSKSPKLQASCLFLQPKRTAIAPRPIYYG